MVDPIGAGAVRMLEREVEFRVQYGDGRFWSQGCGGGSEVLALLPEMPFGRCNGLREMFVDELSRQPRPSGKIAGVDSFEPSGLGWAEADTVQVGDKVALVAHLVDIVGVLADEHVVCWRSGEESARKWCGQWRVGEADVPEAVVVIAVAVELVDAIAPEGDVVCGEYRLEPAVAELADGEQGAVT